jgi:hypothetical protein
MEKSGGRTKEGDISRGAAERARWRVEQRTGEEKQRIGGRT